MTTSKPRYISKPQPKSEHLNYEPSSLEPYYSNSPKLFTTEQHDGEASTYIKTSHTPKRAVNPERQTDKRAKGEKWRRIVTQLRILLSLLVSITTVSCLFFLLPHHKKQAPPLAESIKAMVFEEELANLSIDLSQMEVDIQQEMNVSLTQIEQYLAGITQLVDEEDVSNGFLKPPESTTTDEKMSHNVPSKVTSTTIAIITATATTTITTIATTTTKNPRPTPPPATTPSNLNRFMRNKIG